MCVLSPWIMNRSKIFIIPFPPLWACYDTFFYFSVSDYFRDYNTYSCPTRFYFKLEHLELPGQGKHFGHNPPFASSMLCSCWELRLLPELFGPSSCLTSYPLTLVYVWINKNLAGQSAGRLSHSFQWVLLSEILSTQVLDAKVFLQYFLNIFSCFFFWLLYLV